MSSFTVSSIRDTENFRVVYGWKCGDKKGIFIKPAGYSVPRPGMPGYNHAMKRLYALILGKQVEVGEVIAITTDTMTARIYYKGKELKHYFPEYNPA